MDAANIQIQTYKSKKCKGTNLVEHNKVHDKLGIRFEGEAIGNNIKEQCSQKQSISVDLQIGSNIFHYMLGSTSLKHALHLLGLSGLLTKLDKHLEMTKHGEKSKIEHEAYFSESVNGAFKELSAKYHPDRMKSNGGSTEEGERIRKIHKIVISVWGILNMLYNNFIAKNFLSHQDFKYASCSKIELDLLSNEEILFNLNEKVLAKLLWLSGIKYEKLIFNLNKFIYFSRSSINSFMHDFNSFERHKSTAFVYFEKYLTGHEKLLDALDLLQTECKIDDSLACLLPEVERMITHNQKQLGILALLKEHSGRRNFKFYREYCHLKVDRNFTLPVLEYASLVLKCSEMIKIHQDDIGRGFWNFSYQNRFSSLSAEELAVIRQKIEAMEVCELHFDLLCCLISYYCHGERANKKIAESILEGYFDVHIKLGEGAAKALSKEIIEVYEKHLKEKFQFIEEISEYHTKDIEYKAEKILEKFSCYLRESTRTKLKEIRENHDKMIEEVSQMDEAFQNSFAELEKETISKIQQLKQTLKSEEQKNRKIYKALTNAEGTRARMEEEIRKGIATKAKMEEENLLEQYQIVEKKMAERFADAMNGIVKIKNEFEELIAIEEERKKIVTMSLH